MQKDPLISPHGGYRKLKSFQIAQLVYDVTYRFCQRYLDKRSRTVDQMIQAARSGVQNIAEGSQVSGTSKKLELKLTSVARASLEELKLDYEDFLRQHSLKTWTKSDPKRQSLIDQRCGNVDEVATWVRDVRQKEKNENNSSPYREIAANAALVLIAVACSLLDRQINALAEDFEKEGGFTEKMYRRRREERGF